MRDDGINAMKISTNKKLKGEKALKVWQKKFYRKKYAFTSDAIAKGNRKEDNSIQTQTIREMMQNHQWIYTFGGWIYIPLPFWYLPLSSEYKYI